MSDHPLPLREQVAAHLKQFAWDFQPIEEIGGFVFEVEGQNSAFRVIIQAVTGETAKLVVYAFAPFKATNDKLAAISEFLTRANYGMYVGSFEMDFADGEIRFRVGIPVLGGQIDPAMLKAVVQAAALTLDKYLPGILAILQRGKKPLEAIALVET